MAEILGYRYSTVGNSREDRRRSLTPVIERCPDTGYYVGYVPGFPGDHSQGETLEELNRNLKEVIELLLKERSSTPMKKCAYLIILVMLLGSTLSCQGPGARDRYVLPHVGNWIGVDASGMRAVVVFRENGTGTIEFQNTVNEFHYVFDYSRNPLWLDLVYSREGKPFRTKLIAGFMDENRLKWYTFFDERRPSEFPKGHEAGNVMTLTRLNPRTKV